MAVRSSAKLCSCDIVRSFLYSGGHQAAARDATTSLVSKNATPLDSRTCDVFKCQINQSLAAESCMIYKCRPNRSTFHSDQLSLNYGRSLQKTKTYTDQLKINKVPGIVQFVPPEDKLETAQSALHKPSAVQLSVILLRLREQVCNNIIWFTSISCFMSNG